MFMLVCPDCGNNAFERVVPATVTITLRVTEDQYEEEVDQKISSIDDDGDGQMRCNDCFSELSVDKLVNAPRPRWMDDYENES